MSLKAFHIVFILASILLAFAVGGWCVSEYRAGQGTGYIISAVGSFFIAAGLMVYGRYFLRKFRRMSYL